MKVRALASLLTVLLTLGFMGFISAGSLLGLQFNLSRSDLDVITAILYMATTTATVLTVQTLLEEYLHARTAKEPIPPLLVGLILAYNLALFLFLVRITYYLSGALQLTLIQQALLEPETRLAVSAVVLLFAVISFWFIFRPLRRKRY